MWNRYARLRAHKTACTYFWFWHLAAKMLSRRQRCPVSRRFFSLLNHPFSTWKGIINFWTAFFSTRLLLVSLSFSLSLSHSLHLCLLYLSAPEVFATRLMSVDCGFRWNWRRNSRRPSFFGYRGIFFDINQIRKLTVGKKFAHTAKWSRS